MHLDQPLNDVCFKNLLHRRVLLVIAIPTVVRMYSNYNPVIFMAIFIFVTGQPESCREPPSSLHDGSRSSPLHAAAKGGYCCRGLCATWQNQGNSKAVQRAAKGHLVWAKTLNATKKVLLPSKWTKSRSRLSLIPGRHAKHCESDDLLY